MKSNDPLDLLRQDSPPSRTEARDAALRAAMARFDENSAAAPQGSDARRRPTGRIIDLVRDLMHRKLSATPAIAGLLVLPIAGYAGWALVNENPFGLRPAGQQAMQQPEQRPVTADRQAPVQRERNALPEPMANATPGQPATELAETEAAREAQLAKPVSPAADAMVAPNAAPPLPAAPSMAAPRGESRLLRSPLGGASKVMATPAPMPEPSLPAAENADRLQGFDTNPIRSVLENPVSTFSIDVDTASYSYVRRALKEGVMPAADSVRVEEMINYFPYDWKGPADRATPFNSTVTVMPTPWNPTTKLMHVAIKGYDVVPAERPAANLVFLIDTSGSMNAPDRLPLLKSAFRMLVSKLTDRDRVSIVTYAGSAGTVLEPTSGAERQKILDALDRLQSGGSTAGEAGIREAYRLAQASFVKDGVNRVMLATDGDFNVGPSSDEELKRLVEEKRRSGVFLSVFGFGRGNFNDRMMQAIAQNGNGTAAYIDTLAEAEKTLVQEAGSTLFTIAKDVKLQVEFNPQTISEYRLIGYETRALKREDFNDDRVDAGEIGSGHSVTAIYEMTPKGSSAQAMDNLRYGEAAGSSATGVAHGDEYAFVKIRYKLPNEDVSKLITTPVTAGAEVTDFAAAGSDQRFSVAVAAFGQKLRDTSALADFSWERIGELAAAARGADPFGYRAEFLSLVRLAGALDRNR